MGQANSTGSPIVWKARAARDRVSNSGTIISAILAGIIALVIGLAIDRARLIAAAQTDLDFSASLAAVRVGDLLMDADRALVRIVASHADRTVDDAALARSLDDQVAAMLGLIGEIDGAAWCSYVQGCRPAIPGLSPWDTLEAPVPEDRMSGAGGDDAAVARRERHARLAWLSGARDTSIGGKVALFRQLPTARGAPVVAVAAVFSGASIADCWDLPTVRPVVAALTEAFKPESPPIFAAPWTRITLSSGKAIPGFPLVVRFTAAPAIIGVDWVGGALSGLVGVVVFLLVVLLARRPRPAATAPLGPAPSDERIGELTSALAERELLFREMDHRVKNNLQLISSLISLQASKIEDAGAREAMQASLERVHSVSLVHELLDRRDAQGFVDLHEYLTNLCSRITRAYLPAHRLTCDVDADRVNFTLEVTTRLALVVNEVVTNAVKHAFPNEATGTITVVFRKGEKESRLMIADDGIGMPNRPSGPVDSLGLQLVEMLARYLKGTFQYQSGEFGTVFTLSFPEPGAIPS